MTTNSHKLVLAYDVYGTLLSTSSIAEKLSSIYGKDKGPQIATQWRRYQLEYTWRLNSMNTYIPFDEVTKRSLHHAVNESHNEVQSSHASDLMKEYNKLDAFPDAKSGLDIIEKLVTKHSNIEHVLFSNGTKDMVVPSMQESPTFGNKYDKLFKRTILIDDMPEGQKVYKPSAQTYKYLSQQVEAPLNGIWLISSNPFDIVGAYAVGMKTAWIDRVGSGWVDALSTSSDKLDPHVVGSGLEEILQDILKQENINL